MQKFLLILVMMTTAINGNIQKVFRTIATYNIKQPMTKALASYTCRETSDYCSICPKRKKLFKPREYNDFYRAIIENNIDKVTFYLGHGMNVNHDFGHGLTPLHMCARYGHTELAELFIKHDSNVNAEHDLFGSPLHVAVFHNQIGLVKVLLAAKSYVHTQNYDGHTVLQIAKSNRFNEIYDLLIKAGA